MFCCIGDLHLEKLDSRIEGFTGLALKTLSHTITTVRDSGITTFVFMGDIFDGPDPSQNSQVSFLKCLSRFDDCKFYLLMGNHDFSDITKHSLSLTQWAGTVLKNIKVITKPKVLKLGGVKVWACPHPFVEPAPEKVAWCLGHFAVNGSKSDNGFAIRTKHAPKGRWLLGDFHTPQSGKSKSCRFTYIGSLVQLSWSEKTGKRVVVVDDSGDLQSVKIKLPYFLKTVSVGKGKPPKLKKNWYVRIKTSTRDNLDQDWLRDNPNIVKIDVASKKKDKRAQVALDSLVSDDPLKSLEPYLRTTKFDEATLARALEIAATLKR